MAPSSQCWVFPFLLWPVLMLGKLSGGTCAPGAGGYPGRRVTRSCLACLPVLAVCPAAPVVVRVGVSGCGHGAVFSRLQQPLCHMWTLPELF